MKRHEAEQALDRLASLIGRVGQCTPIDTRVYLKEIDDVRAALEEKPPCACGGEEPLLVSETWGYYDDDGCWVVRESPMASLGVDEEAAKLMEPLKIIIVRRTISDR